MQHRATCRVVKVNYINQVGFLLSIELKKISITALIYCMVIILAYFCISVCNLRCFGLFLYSSESHSQASSSFRAAHRCNQLKLSHQRSGSLRLAQFLSVIAEGRRNFKPRSHNLPGSLILRREAPVLSLHEKWIVPVGAICVAINHMQKINFEPPLCLKTKTLTHASLLNWLLQFKEIKLWDKQL